MRTPNRPTGFSLSRICRQRSLTAPAGLYNQKLTHLRLLIDLPLLFEARPQPSITYRSLRDSYKADRDTNAQNSAETNQFSTIGHSSYGNCLSDADRHPPRGWAMRWASSTGVVFSACALGRSGLGQTNTCQISESISEFLGVENILRAEHLCENFGRWKRSEGRAQLGSVRKAMESSWIRRPSRAATGPDKKGGACRMEPARAAPKLFESEEPHATKPRNEMALNPLKTNDPAKSRFAAPNDFNGLRPAMRNPSFRLAKRIPSFSLFLAS